MRTVLKIPIYIVAVIFLFILAAAYLYYFTTLPEKELNNWIDFTASRKSGLNVSFERINRDLWNHLTLEGIRISPVVGSRGPYLRIARLELKYGLQRLLGGHYAFDSLAIDSVLLSFPERSDKRASGDSTAGSFSFPLSASVDRIRISDIQAVLSGDDIIFIDSLILSISNEGNDPELRLLALAARWPNRDFEVRSMTGRLSSSEGGFDLTDISVVTGRSNLSFAGRVDSSFISGLDIVFNFAPVDLDDIRKLTGVKIKGKLNSSGTVRGAIDSFGGETILKGTFMGTPFDDVNLTYRFGNEKLSFSSIKGEVFRAGFEGAGEIDFAAEPEEYEYAGRVEHLNLQDIGPDLRTDFTGYVEMAGRAFNESQFMMQIRCDLHSVEIEDYFFHRAAGDVKFDLREIDFLPGFEARYKNTILTAAGRMEYQEDIDISGNAEFGDLADFTDQTFLKKLGGRGSADFHLTGPTGDFTVDASFESDSCWTYGLAPGKIHIDADLKSFITHRVGTVSGEWTGGELYSVPTDSGHFKTSVSGERVFFDTVYIAGLDGGLWFKGSYDGTQIPPVFEVDTLQGEIYGNSFSSIAPLRLSIYERETQFDDFRLGYETGIIELTGIVTNDLKLGLDISAQGFQIQPILSQIYPEKRIRGIWNGFARLTGDFDDPVMEFDVEIDSLSVDEVNMGKLEAIARYSDGYLLTESARLASEYGDYDFSGRLPMNLSFEKVESRFPDKPSDFRVSTSGNRLLLAESFISNIERFDTDFVFEITLSGTYSNPRIAGYGRLMNGTLDVLDLRNPLTDLRAYLRMENETVYIDSVFATVAEMGKDWGKLLGELLSQKNGARERPLVSATGTLKLLGLGDFLYAIDIRGENVYFVTDAYDVSGLADFDLKVEGETPPAVRGDLFLARLDIRDEFESFVGPDYDPAFLAVEDSTIWDLNLDIVAPNNIWIKNSVIDAEFKADIRVQRRLGVLRFLGTLEAIRGSYNLLGQKFRFVSGKLTYTDLASVDPDIDFVVSTRIRTSRGETEGPKTVELHITGTLLEPTISSSGLSKEELLRTLLAGSWAGGTLSEGGSAQDIVGSMTTIASSMGLDPLTAQGIFEEFDIGQFEEEAQISVAKYISRNLYVRYSRALAKDEQGSVGVEYYFNDNVSFRAIQGLQGSKDEGISFDLNFSHEF